MRKYYGYEINEADLQQINKIGVLCWGLIGDVFFRVPIIEALKQRFPDSVIIAIVDPAGKAVLENHPDCDEVFVLSRKKKPLLNYLSNSVKGIINLRNRHLDLFINLYSGGSSPIITRLVNARIRLGFDHTKALRKSNNLLVSHPVFCKKWTQAFGTLLRPLGIAKDDIHKGTSFYISESGMDYARSFFSGDLHKYVVINAGARIAEKRWPIEKFAQLSKRIQIKYGLSPLVITNPGMEELAHEFENLYRNLGHYRIAPLSSLDNVAGLMRFSQFVITGDTSLMHLALGIKCPTLVLFTYTRPDVIEADDRILSYCFVPQPDIFDECGNPMGNANIDVDYAYEKFIELHEKNKIK